jgi:hypothetical protein
MTEKNLNLFTTRNGTIFISPDRELTADSAVKVLGTFSGFGPAKKLSNFLWTEKSIRIVEFLGSYESLEAAEQAAKASRADLEAVFN